MASAPRTRRSRAARKEPPRAWQRMLSGRRLNILDPSPLDVEIRDIAHGLARVARWNGQTEGEYPYSVAQHSLLVETVAGLLAPEIGNGVRLVALLHDAPEYVVGDLISPFKAAIGERYKDVESRLAVAIHVRFSIGADETGARTALIKAADTVAAYHEATALAGFTPAEAGAIFGTPEISRKLLAEHLTPWPTRDAEARFLDRFEALDKGE